MYCFLDAVLHESTCAEKCAKFVKWNLQDRMAYLTPNFAELLHIHLALTGEDLEEKKDTSGGDAPSSLLMQSVACQRDVHITVYYIVLIS